VTECVLPAPVQGTRPDPLSPDRCVAARILARQEPDEEEEEDPHDGEKDNDDEDDHDDSDDGYSE
jgi:hypothetical protein